MPVPTLVTSYYVPSAASDLSSLVTPSFTPANGEVLIVKAASETVNGPIIGLASGGSQTFTSQVNFSQANQCPVRIFSAVVSGSPGVMSVSVAFSGTAGWHSVVVERWSSAQLAATPATVATVSSGAPSGTLTTVSDGSCVSWVDADWAAVAPGSPVYRSSAVQEGLHDKSGTSYVAYFARQTTTVAGSQTIGLTAPGGQSATLAGIEVQGVDAGAVTAWFIA